MWRQCQLLVQGDSEVYNRFLECSSWIFGLQRLIVDFRELVPVSNPNKLRFIGIELEPVGMNPPMKVVEDLFEPIHCISCLRRSTMNIRLDVIGILMSSQTRWLDDPWNLGSEEHIEERAKDWTLRYSEFNRTPPRSLITNDHGLLRPRRNDSNHDSAFPEWWNNFDLMLHLKVKGQGQTLKTSNSQISKSNNSKFYKFQMYSFQG